MPTYVCTAAAGLLDAASKSRIASLLAKVHSEETGAARYFVQVIFHEVKTENHFVAGKPAPADQLWIRGDIRAGRTAAQKDRMLTRMSREVGGTLDTAPENVWVYLNDIPAEAMSEYGHVLPLPGGEQAWFEGLPAALRERLGKG